MKMLFHPMLTGRVMNTFDPKSNRFYRFALLYWIAVFSALLLWSRKWGIVRATSTEQEHLFGLFGFCVFCVIAYCAYADLKPLQHPTLRRIILISLPFLVSLFLLSLTVELSQQKSWDYDQYETAFRSVSVGDNPYRSTRYLYPPTFANVMVSVNRLGERLFSPGGLAGKELDSWVFVFYIHQSALLFALLFAYYLSLQLAERVGLSPLKGMLFVSALFLFNVPLLRTLSYNQVNFYILVSILVSMLALTRRPFVSGVSVALGGLIKLYPFAFVAPLLLMKKWKALLGVAVSALIVLALDTNLFRDLTLWKQFVLFYTSFPVERESSWFRNSSPLSFVRNSLAFLGAPEKIVTPIFAIALLAIVVWYAVRFFQREKMFIEAKQPSAESEAFRQLGHLMDFSVLSLLIAPSAWEHHYVIVIPLAIWTFALCGKDAPWLTAIGILLVFALPVFNFYPFSYLRMAGLILLLILASPQKIRQI
jgi:hypothetical protein